MGHGPRLLPVAPPRRGWRSVLTAWLPACLVPVGLAFGGLAWVRTSVCVCGCVFKEGRLHGSAGCVSKIREACIWTSMLDGWCTEAPPPPAVSPHSGQSFCIVRG